MADTRGYFRCVHFIIVVRVQHLPETRTVSFTFENFILKNDNEKVLVIRSSVIGILLLFINYRDEKARIKLPRNIEDAKELGSILSRYKNKYYFEVLVGVLVVYIL